MALNKTDYNRKSVADDINSLKLDESSMDDMFNTDSLLDLLDEVSSQEDELKKAVNSNIREKYIQMPSCLRFRRASITMLISEYTQM